MSGWGIMMNMMKYLIAVAMLLILGGTTCGTMWLYDGDFFMLGPQYAASSFAPQNITPFEIINAPFFPLLGETFYKNPLPVQVKSTASTVEIGSTGTRPTAPVQVTFSGNLENNLKYAQSKSSLRIGKEGSWASLNVPGVI
jgi:hypothetical protein